MCENSKLYKFANCRILRDHKIILEDLWVRNGVFVNPEKLFFDEKKPADVIIDCKNRVIAPGFIEIQINGGFGYDFSFETKTEEGLAIVSKKLLEHGITAFCPTVVTSPEQIYHKVLPKLKFRQGGKHGATILGAHVEGPFINKEKKGAHPPTCILSFEKGIEQLEKTYGSLDSVRIVTLAPELGNSAEVIQSLKQRNIVVSLGHSIADLSQSEEAVFHGANVVTHLFNAMLPFHHRDPGLVGLLASDKLCDTHPIYFGLIPDGIHTHPAAMRIAYRIHPDGIRFLKLHILSSSKCVC
ncbi:hypothetical protein ABEB36_005461 [Hypothenemus hampei]|uniref:N-acetylglucosamine-6-phosphate deacetylase n=1 Tax=Hypothenemus hampei TaxID=57062 RepID=A0ABD1F253_HYPHA